MREDGSLMGRAQALGAEALQERGIKSRSQSPGMAVHDQNCSFIHWSIYPGNITKVPTVCVVLC